LYSSSHLHEMQTLRIYVDVNPPPPPRFVYNSVFLFSNFFFLNPLHFLCFLPLQYFPLSPSVLFILIFLPLVSFVSN
jgi:hypothetical protein